MIFLVGYELTGPEIFFAIIFVFMKDKSIPQNLK